MVADAPEYFFSVARQPDIVNTARLNGVDVSRSISYLVMNTSVATRSSLEINITEQTASPASLGVECQAPSEILLSGSYLTALKFMRRDYS